MDRTFQFGAALALATVMGLAATTSVVQAQTNCATYGNLALKQARESQQRKCGFKGPRWSTDLKAHVAWCGGVGPVDWQRELKKRASMLKQCGR